MRRWRVLERDFVNSQDFILSLKMGWTKSLYPQVREKFLAIDEDKRNEMSVADIEDLIGDDPDYHFFSWCERHLQKLKYSGAYGLHPFHKERSETLTDELREEEIEKAESFILPDYYKAIDIHQQPGGVWSDPVAGFIYERGARTTTPMLGNNHKDLHYRFAETLFDAKDSENWTGTIIDLGCGFGKSTRPISEFAPKSSIVAIDLAEPCLKLGRLEAQKNQNTNIKFKQADARITGCADESIDLATSTMLLHEMPKRAIIEMFSETFRILKSGGRAVHLDFWLMRDAFDRFIFEGHSWRNNEPFMRPLFSMDLPKILREIGFTDIAITPFQEAEHIDPITCPFWRFPWTRISMSKPE